MQGWIKLHRKVLDNEIWQDVTAFRLFTLLLLKASHKDGIKTRGIEINRGQYLRSYSKLAEDLEYTEGRGVKKVSKSTIERKIKKLVGLDMVAVSETLSGTLFTILKYDDYQGFDEPSKSFSGTDNETKMGRPRDDGGTNLVQEQELKNLRTKELKNLSSSSSVAPDHPMIDLNLKSVIDFYEQQSFGMITPHVADKMAEWIADTSKELVIHAMKLAIESGAVKWSYAEGILKNWITRKLTTVEQVEAYELQRKQEKAAQLRPTIRKNTREERVPEWFANRQPKKQMANDSTPIDFDVEAERRKLMQELGISGNGRG